MFAILAAGISNDALVSVKTFRMVWKLPDRATVILALAGLAARAQTVLFSGTIIALSGTCGEDEFAYPYGAAVHGESSLHTIPSECNHLSCGGQLGSGFAMRKPSSHLITAAQ